jgi:hypothetical protein
MKILSRREARRGLPRRQNFILEEKLRHCKNWVLTVGREINILFELKKASFSLLLNYFESAR